MLPERKKVVMVIWEFGSPIISMGFSIWRIIFECYDEAFVQNPSFVSAVRCTQCGCMILLRTVAFFSPALIKILRGLGVSVNGLGCTGLWYLLGEYVPICMSLLSAGFQLDGNTLKLG